MTYDCSSRPNTPEEFDICEKKDTETIKVPGLKVAHGWIATARQQNPNSMLLGRLTNMYNDHARKWCTKEGKKTERLNDKITSDTDDTCAIFDLSGETLKQYCLEKDRLNPGKSVTPQCTEPQLGTVTYQELAKNYCGKNRQEQWCFCNNIVQEYCDDTPDAAGCAFAKLDPQLADDSVLGQEDYDKLLELAHCRSGVCTTDQFIPDNRKGCPDKITLCGKSFDVRSVKNSDIIRQCVLGRGGTEEDIENLLKGEPPSLEETMKLLEVLNQKDSKYDAAKDARKREDKYMMMCIVVSCMCLMGIAAMTSAKQIPK